MAVLCGRAPGAVGVLLVGEPFEGLGDGRLGRLVHLDLVFVGGGRLGSAGHWDEGGRAEVRRREERMGRLSGGQMASQRRERRVSVKLLTRRLTLLGSPGLLARRCRHAACCS